MADYKQIVSEAGKLIEQSEMADLLRPIWKGIEWNAHPEETSGRTETALSTDGRAIHLYPLLKMSPKAGELVLREFGKLILISGGGDRAQAIWDKKLDVPTPDQVRIAAEKIADPALRKTCHEYKDVLDTYPQKGGSVNRLVFLNIANALLANNIPYTDSVGVDIMTWGPTTEYCRLKKYHSLVPLVSAYAPNAVFSDFGSALAAFLMNPNMNVRDQSVAFALRGILQRIVKLVGSA